MKLYCWPHNTTHTFTAGDVEKIVYTLIGALSDESMEGPETPAGEMPRLACPKDMLAMAYDGECYSEHVEQGVECRRDHDRLPAEAETPIVRESTEEALENDRCGICLSVDHFREDCPSAPIEHRPERRGSDSEGYGVCTGCGDLWPCATYRGERLRP